MQGLSATRHAGRILGDQGAKTQALVDVYRSTDLAKIDAGTNASGVILCWSSDLYGGGKN